MKLIKQFLILAGYVVLQCSSAVAQSIEKWFPKQELMRFGCSYPIASIPEKEWANDFAQMAALGFSFVRIGENTWPYLEKEEGKFDFSVLDQSLVLASKNNLQVVISLPTATLPIWFIEKHPDALVADAAGNGPAQGTSNGGSFSSAAFCDHSEKMATELAKKYGKDKRVIGWQLHSGSPDLIAEYDYSRQTTNHFGEWLNRKYGNIDKLNAAWQGSGILYSDFNQVRIPGTRMQNQPANPQAMLDYRRFFAEEFNGFISLQAKALRNQISKEQWITAGFSIHNLTHDPALAKEIDFVSTSVSPVSGAAIGHGTEGYRIGYPSSVTQGIDYLTGIKGRIGISEIQIGQSSSGRNNPQPLPGAFRLWLYQCMAQGCLFAVVPFRAVNFGNEQYQPAVMSSDGKQISTGGKEVAKVIQEISTLQKDQKSAKAVPQKVPALKTGILYSRSNVWDMQQQRLTTQWNPTLHITKWYETARALQAPVNFVSEETEFGDFPFLIVPAYQMVDDELISKLVRYAEKGGNLLVTCRFGQKDKSGKLFAGGLQPGLKKLVGAQVRFFDMLPDDKAAKVTWGGRNFDWNNWAEILELEKETKATGQYADQFYKNGAAICQKKTGKGWVTYIGVETDAFKLESEILHDIYKKTVAKPLEELAPGLEIAQRDGIWFGLNYHSTDNRIVNIPEGAQIISGNKELKPCEVVIWKEK